MMRRAVFVLAAPVLVLVALLPAASSAQGIGIAARAGTLGLGGEVAVGVSGMLQVRGGAGWFPVDFEDEYSDLEYRIEPTSPLANVGVDLFPFGRGFRIGGGLLFISEDTRLQGIYTGQVEVGGGTYDGSQAGTLRASVNHGGTAPYAVIGFGRGTGSGLGFFLDLGAAFLNDAKVDLTADGPLAQDPGQAGQTFRANLEIERREAEEDLNEYHRFLPIVSVGFRIGLR